MKWHGKCLTINNTDLNQNSRHLHTQQSSQTRQKKVTKIWKVLPFIIIKWSSIRRFMKKMFVAQWIWYFSFHISFFFRRFIFLSVRSYTLKCQWKDGKGMCWDMSSVVNFLNHFLSPTVSLCSRCDIVRMSVVKVMWMGCKGGVLWVFHSFCSSCQF